MDSGLRRNDGKGGFRRSPEYLPPNHAGQHCPTYKSIVGLRYANPTYMKL